MKRPHPPPPLSDRDLATIAAYARTSRGLYGVSAYVERMRMLEAQVLRLVEEILLERTQGRMEQHSLFEHCLEEGKQ